eukprot:9469373-Pyramimonas_sp.AAC.1
MRQDVRIHQDSRGRSTGAPNALPSMFGLAKFINDKVLASNSLHAFCASKVLPNIMGTHQLFVAKPKLGVILGRADKT